MLLKIVMSKWKYHMWNMGAEIITIPISESTHFGVSSPKTSISLAGCNDNTYLELIKILHMVKYLNEEGDVEGSACWWLFSYLAAFFCVSYTANDDFSWRKYREKPQNLSLFPYSPSRTFALLSQKKLKRQKKGKKPCFLPASLHHYWIRSHLAFLLHCLIFYFF